MGTRYVARIDLLTRTGLCYARRDLEMTPGKPRIVQCAECGAFIHLGPINMGVAAFEDHREMRHTMESSNQGNFEGSASEDSDSDGEGQEEESDDDDRSPEGISSQDDDYEGDCSEGDTSDGEFDDGELF